MSDFFANTRPGAAVTRGEATFELPILYFRDDCFASLRPFMTRYYLERSGILPSGKVVERDVRPLPGYRGADGVGEHVLTYT